jgi:hypothetical protein
MREPVKSGPMKLQDSRRARPPPRPSGVVVPTHDLSAAVAPIRGMPSAAAVDLPQVAVPPPARPLRIDNEVLPCAT